MSKVTIHITHEEDGKEKEEWDLTFDLSAKPKETKPARALETKSKECDHG